MIREDDVGWAIRIQNEVAMPQIYEKLWPNLVIHLDDESSELKRTLDIAGADKLIKDPNGGVFFLGQRFRTYESSLAKGYDDFTLRNYRPRTNYKAECFKVIDALKTGKLLAAYYAYGHLHSNQKQFKKFRIIYFRKFVEKWDAGVLNPYQKKDNHDGSSDFYAWRFKDIPLDCIYWSLKKQYKKSSKLTDFGGS